MSLITACFSSVSYTHLAHRHKVHPQAGNFEGDLAKRLDPITVKEHLFILPADQPSDFGNIQHGAQFVVHQHSADQDGVFIHGLGNFFRRQGAVRLRRDKDHLDVYKRQIKA